MGEIKGEINQAIGSQWIYNNTYTGNTDYLYKIMENVEWEVRNPGFFSKDRSWLSREPSSGADITRPVPPARPMGVAAACQ